MIAPVNFYNVDNYEFYLDPKKPGFLSMCLAPELVGVNKDMVIANLQEKAETLRSKGVSIKTIHQDTPQVDILFDLRTRRARVLFEEIMRVDLRAAGIEADLGPVTDTGSAPYNPKAYEFKVIGRSRALLVMPKRTLAEKDAENAAIRLLEIAQLLESDGIKYSLSAAQLMAEQRGDNTTHPGIVFHIMDARQQNVFNAIMEVDLKSLGMDFEKRGQKRYNGRMQQLGMKQHV